VVPELTAAEQAAYLAARAERSRKGRFAEIIGMAGTTTEVLPGNEILDGRLNSPKAGDEAAEQPRMGR